MAESRVKFSRLEKSIFELDDWLIKFIIQYEDKIPSEQLEFMIKACQIGYTTEKSKFEAVFKALILNIEEEVELYHLTPVQLSKYVSVSTQEENYFNSEEIVNPVISALLDTVIRAPRGTVSGAQLDNNTVIDTVSPSGAPVLPMNTMIPVDISDSALTVSNDNINCEPVPMSEPVILSQVEAIASLSMTAPVTSFTLDYSKREDTADKGEEKVN